MKTLNRHILLTACETLVMIVFLAGTLTAQEPLQVDEPAAAAHVGDSINITYHVVNVGSEKKKFTCMLSFDPPTGEKPSCKVQDIELGPGETYNGALGELAQLPVNSRVTVKLLDENQNVISEQTFPVNIVEPGRIACGDSLCDLGENSDNCPKDCRTGGKDGYCDKIADGVCDPDCSRTQDADCVCNRDGSCDFLLQENYASCPQDCASGSADGYCDKTADGKCDPDCSAAEDIDCKQETPISPPPQDNSPLIPYIMAAGILIVVLIAGTFLFYRKVQNGKIEKEREEFSRWKEKQNGI